MKPNYRLNHIVNRKKLVNIIDKQKSNYDYSSLMESQKINQIQNQSRLYTIRPESLLYYDQREMFNMSILIRKLLQY